MGGESYLYLTEIFISPCGHLISFLIFLSNPLPSPGLPPPPHGVYIDRCISRAKSGKLKSQKAPSLLGKQRQSGNIRFTVGQYGLIDGGGGRRIWTGGRPIWTGGEVAEIKLFHKQFFRDWSGTIRKSRENFFPPP